MAWNEQTFAGNLTAAQLTALQANIIALNRGKIDGLVLSNNSGQPLDDVDIAAGICVDSTAVDALELTATMIKQIDAVWAAGSDAGGMFTGSVGNNTWYHLFLIKDITTGIVDAGFDTSVVAANIPSGYTLYRRIGSVLTDGSANITAFTAQEVAGGGLKFIVVITQAFTETPGATTEITKTLVGVPTGIRVEADISARQINASVSYTIIGGGDETLPAATSVLNDLQAVAGATGDSLRTGILTNLSGQVKYRTDDTTGNTIEMYLHGWTDFRK